MKVMATMALLLAFHAAVGQVILRNDFIINRKFKQWENKGITHITFGFGHTNWNLNAYGQPVKAITINVRALAEPAYMSYRELAEVLYRPVAVYRQSYIPIPLFLLLEPPRHFKRPSYSYDVN